MTIAFANLPHTGIQALKPYQPGKSCAELKREFGIDDIIKLASNENPLGFSPKVNQALVNTINQTSIYPDSSCYELTHALAKHLDLTPSHFIVSNGSDSLIPLIIKAFCLGQNKKVLFPQYSFISYKLQSQLLAVESIEIPSPNYEIDIDNIIKNLDKNVGVIFIANPNNPTGNWLNHQQVERLAQRVPSSTILVLDEAYYEFAPKNDYPDTIALQQKYPNIIATRTFSKAYGLANLRIGYAIANPEIIEILTKILPPFSVTSFSQNAAIAALGDQDFVHQTLSLNRQGIDLYCDYFNNQSINFINTTTNFITMDCGENSTSCYDFLLKNGIIVRPLIPYNMPNHLRISIGLPQQNQRVIDALKLWRKT